MRISDWSSDVCSSDLDEATAVLVGDSLQSLAFEVLGSEQTHKDPFVRAELVLALARAAAPSGMAGGQMMDLEAEKAGFDLAAVTRLQQLKPSALISFLLEEEGIMAHVPSEARGGLRLHARVVRLAFKIADDLL